MFSSSLVFKFFLKEEVTVPKLNIPVAHLYLMKPTIEQDEMFPEGVIPPTWEMEEVYSIFSSSLII